MLSIPDHLLGDKTWDTNILSRWTTWYNLFSLAYNWQSSYFYVFDTTYFPFIWRPPHRLHDERDLSALLTDMKMKNLDEKNPYDICKAQDFLDDWRHELNKWTPADDKPVGFKSTWYFSEDDVSGFISSWYFIPLTLLRVLLA